MVAQDFAASFPFHQIKREDEPETSDKTQQLLSCHENSPLGWPRVRQVPGILNCFSAHCKSCSVLTECSVHHFDFGKCLLYNGLVSFTKRKIIILNAV